MPEFLLQGHRRPSAARRRGERSQASLQLDRPLATDANHAETGAEASGARARHAGVRGHAQLEAVHPRRGDRANDRPTASARGRHLPGAAEFPHQRGLYRQAALERSAPAFAVDFVESWHDHPLLIQAFAEKLSRDGSKLVTKPGHGFPSSLLRTAFPQRTVAEGDPYEAQATANRGNWWPPKSDSKTEHWTFAFQSQGMSGGAWLGPTVERHDSVELKAKAIPEFSFSPSASSAIMWKYCTTSILASRSSPRSTGMRLWRAESLNESPLWRERWLSEVGFAPGPEPNESA